MSELATLAGGNVVEWAPVNVQVTGKTMKDKRLSVINNTNDRLTMAAAAYLANMKGKVGEAVRDRISVNGEFMIAKNVLDGNYKPLAQAIAVRLGKNITLTSRKDYEALRWTFEYELGNLRNGGVSSSGKDTDAKKQLVAVLQLLAEVQQQVDAIVATKREQREQDAPQGEASVAEQLEAAEQATA